NPNKANTDGGTAVKCDSAPPLDPGTVPSSCSGCTPQGKCADARPISACCAWVGAPTVELARGTGLHYFTSDSPTVDLGCLRNPGPKPDPGASKSVRLTGYVKLFSSGLDSESVKIQVFKEGNDGALGDAVGTPYTTTADDAADPPQMPLPNWLKKCQPD